MKFLIPAVLFAALGIFSIVAAVANWEWFFQTKNASFLAHYLNRNGTRICYGLIGIGLLFMAYNLFIETSTI